MSFPSALLGKSRVLLCAAQPTLSRLVTKLQEESVHVQRLRRQVRIGAAFSGSQEERQRYKSFFGLFTDAANRAKGTAWSPQQSEFVERMLWVAVDCQLRSVKVRPAINIVAEWMNDEQTRRNLSLGIVSAATACVALLGTPEPDFTGAVQRTLQATDPARNRPTEFTAHLQVSLLSSFATIQCESKVLLLQLSKMILQEANVGYTAEHIATLSWALGTLDCGAWFMPSLCTMAARPEMLSGLNQRNAARLLWGAAKVRFSDKRLLRSLCTKHAGHAMNMGDLVPCLWAHAVLDVSNDAFIRAAECAILKCKSWKTVNLTEVLSLADCVSALAMPSSVMRPIVATGYHLLHHITAVELSRLILACSYANYTPEDLQLYAFAEVLRDADMTAAERKEVAHTLKEAKHVVLPDVPSRPLVSEMAAIPRSPRQKWRLLPPVNE